MALSTPLVFACLGDSIALNAPTRAETQWPMRLDRLLAPSRGACNRGKNSTVTSDWLSRYNSTIKTLGFGGVIIGPCAFNDANTGVAAATSFSNIQSIVTDALSRNMFVAIITGLPAGSAAGWNGTKQTAHDTLRASILGLTPTNKLAIVDAYSAFGQVGSPTILDPQWQGPDLDGTHIGQAGGDKLADLVYAGLQTLS